MTIAGQAYNDLIVAQLAEERAAKASIEQRASGVIGSSGTLVTLLLALAALVTSSKTFELSVLTRVLLGVAVVLFVVAAAVAIYINWPRKTYEEANLANIKKLVDDPDAWSEDFASGLNNTADASLSILKSARTVNTQKAGWLRWAMRAEIAAIGTLAITAISALTELGAPQPGLLKVQTATDTYCGSVLASQGGQVVVDDQFRHHVQALRAAAIQSEAVVQACS